MEIRKERVLFLVVVFFIISWLFNDFLILKEYNDKRYYLHTITEIHILCRNKYQAHKAINAAFARIKTIEQKINYFDPTSELSKINREAYGKPVTLSIEMQDVLEQALAGSRLSQGAFDITTTPITRLYGFGKSKNYLPNNLEIKNTLQNVGYQYVLINTANHTVQFLKPGLKIDLGGIKGYAVDQAAAVLKDQGIQDGLINAGGNIYALGTNHGKPWKIAIRDPRQKENITNTFFTLSNQGCATSGDYEQFFFSNNKRISHIFNPRTGQPANQESQVMSVTVVTQNATWADILAKPCFIWGPAKTQKVFPELETYFFTKQP